MIVPNPSTGQNIRISLRNYQKMLGYYDVLTYDGRVVAQGALDSYHTNLELSFLPSGFYFLRIKSSSKVYISKFIISK
jgi:hypothetical protein